MSDDFERIGIIAGRARRRRWGRKAKLRIVEETLTGGDSVFAVVPWRGTRSALPLASVGDRGRGLAVQADNGVTGKGEVRRLEERMRELERQLGRKTLEVEILEEALAKWRAKKPTLLARSPLTDGSR
jgi:transposase